MPRRSSGSCRVDSAVEPTRSQIITVSALAGVLRIRFGCLGGLRWSRGGCAPGKLGNGSQHLAPMSERNPYVLKVLIGQKRQNADIVDVIFGKALLVLG
jgi:hypothetical protein